MTETPTIADGIAQAQTLNYTPQFSPTRWPYTYACDYLRTHPEIVPAEVWKAADARGDLHNSVQCLSRGEASVVRTIWAELTGITDHDAARQLAFAYCQEHKIDIPDSALIETAKEST